ncbi:hypothetical protein FRZ03_22395 [Streptomyces misionensis]|uniref:Uncharacterized protein n=1 Tax=Streptomyces misionensis TaxID=67331 RepID=A0A5C6JJ17_9ACTN|nr:hypothetical protein FRZ03_22395 [Streptomyces misionensis]
MWRRLGRDGEQTSTDALGDPDGHALYCAQEDRAGAEDEQRRATQREMEHPVRSRCGRRCTDERSGDRECGRVRRRLSGSAPTAAGPIRPPP